MYDEQGSYSIIHALIRNSTKATPLLLRSHAGDIQSMYTLQSSKIGEGTYGSVAIGTHNSTKAQRAIKTMSKANMHLDGN